MNNVYKNLSAVILAGGESRRFKGNKLLECRFLYKGRSESVLKIIVKKFLKSGVCEVVIAAGKYYLEIRKELQNISDRVKILNNRQYKKGIGSSVRLGINYCRKKGSDVLLSLGDKPFIRVGDIKRISREAGSGRIVQPFHNGIHGHPVLIPHKYLEFFKNMKPDKGAKQILKKMRRKKIKIRDSGICIDIDTKRTYNRLKDKEIK